MKSGVYQPRPPRAVMSDAFDAAKRSATRFFREAGLRGAGALLLLVAIAGVLALVFYNPGDASLNNATETAPKSKITQSTAAAVANAPSVIGSAVSSIARVGEHAGAE